jgi:hypothetical protein
MATTTPNFGWAVPTSTDLVKDGAVAIETLGDSIDASLLDLKGGTTGQVLSKASNTDMDFSWVAQDDSNAIQNAIVDAKGDIIAATANDTPARLAVGANDTVLTADSSTATGLKWAAPSSGGMTLLSTTTLTGSSVTISSINQTYTNLYVQITGATFSAAGNCTLKINAITDSFWVGGVEADSTTPVLRVYGGNTALTIFKDTQTGGNHVMSFTISNYTESTYHTIQGAYTNVSAAFEGGYYGGGWSPIAGGAAVTQLIIATTAGSFNAGTVKIYGVK